MCYEFEWYQQRRAEEARRELERQERERRAREEKPREPAPARPRDGEPAPVQALLRRPRESGGPVFLIPTLDRNSVSAGGPRRARARLRPARRGSPSR